MLGDDSIIEMYFYKIILIIKNFYIFVPSM